MEIHRCFIQLPSKQGDEVFVYATKKIDLEGHRDVSVRSLAVPIQQDNLRAGRFFIVCILQERTSQILEF